MIHINKYKENKVINFEKLIEEFIEFCIKNNPKTLTEIFIKFGAPRHLKKDIVIKLLKVLKHRDICYFSLYNNLFILSYSPATLEYIKKINSQNITEINDNKHEQNRL